MSESGDDILDRIAQDLPIEIRAAFYRELNYCRSLPENDELLRVLRAMQVLTLLMREAPARVVIEREKLELIFNSAMAKLSATLERAEAYQSTLEQRLAALPAKVAEGLSPEMVARSINENLRQQFVESTLPQTAQAMTCVAAQLRSVVVEFAKTAAMLNDSHRGAAARARQAIEEIERTISSAAGTARRAAKDLSEVFQLEFRWSVYVLSTFGLVVGVGLGMLYQHWIDTPPETAAQRAPLVERAPAMIKQKGAH
jgi:hypothetical protein